MQHFLFSHFKQLQKARTLNITYNLQAKNRHANRSTGCQEEIAEILRRILLNLKSWSISDQKHTPLEIFPPSSQCCISRTQFPVSNCTEIRSWKLYIFPSAFTINHLSILAEKPQVLMTKHMRNDAFILSSSEHCVYSFSNSKVYTRLYVHQMQLFLLLCICLCLNQFMHSLGHEAIILMLLYAVFYYEMQWHLDILSNQV